MARSRPAPCVLSESGRDSTARNCLPTGKGCSGVSRWFPSSLWRRMAAMVPNVVAVETLDGYRLLVQFDDGVVTEVDLSEDL